MATDSKNWTEIQADYGKYMSEKSEKISGDMAGDQNVDKIREILFGTHIRDYEQRFALLEQRLVAENEKMSAFIEKRLTGIATATQRELAGLAEKIDEQKKQLSAAQDQSRNQLDSLNHQIGERINDLDDVLGKETHALRNDLNEQHNTLLDIVQKTREGLENSLGQEGARLQHEKVQREDLANLLNELAGRLRQNDQAD